MQSLVNEVLKNPFNEESYRFIVDSSDDINPINKRLEKLKKDFVQRLCWYFAGKYKVTISDNFMDKYSDQISYKNILDEIFLQLGGFSFEEKAVNEIKSNMKSIIERYNGDPRVTLKGNKLIFDGLCLVRYDDIWKNYEIAGYYGRESAIKFYTALNHFDHNQKGISGELVNFMDAKGRDNPNLFNKYEFVTMNKLKSIKFYKNGKVDVEFKTLEYAHEFLKDYCGVSIEKVA